MADFSLWFLLVPTERLGFAVSKEETRENGLQIVTEIRLRKGEPIERALRRLKKRVDREGTLKEVRNHRHFEKPSEKKRRKMKIAKFSAMLSARYADL